MSKLAIIIPSYHHQDELLKVLQQIPQQYYTHTYVVDDGSEPKLKASKVQLIRHQQNAGYGAAQKSGYHAALQSDAEVFALIHGDNQYDPTIVLSALSLMKTTDIALGSRMLEKWKKPIPSWRRLGNRLLTGLANHKFGSHCTDLHTGARLYRRQIFEQAPWRDFSDDFVFDQQLLVWALRNHRKLMEFSIPPKYDDTVSSISLSRSITYGLGCVKHILWP